MAGKARTKKPGRPKGQQPVIAVRLPETIYQEVLAKVKADKGTITETVAALVTAGLRVGEAFGDFNSLKAMTDDAFLAEMRRRGWKRIHGTPHWYKAAIPDGFELGAVLDAENQLNKVDAALDEIERRIAALRAERKTK